MKHLLAIILFIACLPLAGQTPTIDELEFEPDSLRSPYKPSGKNYVLIKSKRGTSGVNRTASADAVLASEITEIVLVFSETDPSAIAEREEANRERWENLLRTYPELFQFSTTYKNVCQCNNSGDAEAFKTTQGFYVYVNGDVPQVEEPKVVATPPPVNKTEEAKTAPVKKTEEKPTPAKKAEEKPKDVVAVTTPEAVVTTPNPVKEAPASEKTKEAEAPANEETAPAEPVAKPAAKKKPAVVKARRAKNPKDCRQPCYGFGDEDLIAYFKTGIPLTKKQRRKAKNWVANVRLQIHFDGTIKKAMVTGSDETFNAQVDGLVKSMDNWKAAVKSGVAVKSEVRFTLKYDKETKSIKPFDIISNPKASPKCPCVTDSEIFGSD